MMSHIPKIASFTWIQKSVNIKLEYYAPLFKENQIITTTFYTRI